MVERSSGPEGVERPRVEVGLGALTAQTRSGTAAESTEALTMLLDTCVLAEDEGLDSAWVAEHHFAADGFLSSPMTVLAALSQRTSRIRLSTNVMIGPLYDPIRLAEDAAVVDQLSRGRLMLGFGLGYRDVEFAGLGRRRQERGRRLDDLINVLRQAWSGKPVEHHGLGTYKTPPVTPLPFQQDGPPVLVGAFAEAGLRRAVRLGNGWLAPELRHWRGLEKRVAALGLDSRTDPFHVAVTVNAFVAARDAWETVRPGVAHVAGQYRSWLVESGDLPALEGKEFEYEADETGKPPQFVAGTPEQCVAQLRPWWRILARLPEHVQPHLILGMTFPGVSREATFESVRLLAREVVPALNAEE